MIPYAFPNIEFFKRNNQAPLPCSDWVAVMIEQQGRVIALKDGMARIEVGPVSGCSACDSGVGCGAGLFVQLLRRKATELTVSNGIQAKPGEAVVIGIPEGLFLKLI